MDHQCYFWITDLNFKLEELIEVYKLAKAFPSINFIYLDHHDYDNKQLLVLDKINNLPNGTAVVDTSKSATKITFEYLDIQNTKIELMRRYLQFFEGTLSVEEIISHNSTPDNCVLFQNYPNPFINTTLIKFKLPDKADRYSLTFFNLLGQEVKKFNNINNFQNNNFLIWDGTNNSHTSLPSGTYIYQLKTENKTVCKKMNLIR